MSGQLLELLAGRAAAGKPVRVGLIGAGKFGTMFLSQARRVVGLHVVGIADIAPERARRALKRADWPEEQTQATSLEEALRTGATFITEDAAKLIDFYGVEVLVEATGVPSAGIRHALRAIAHGRHIVMVNVEADVLAGPLLAERAAAAGVVYSLAYGDQPALICELVEWARASGFPVICAGKGTKYLPLFHASTPETVWGYWGFSEEMVRTGDYNPRLFNSFLDGTKSAIEMAAVANATGLTPQPEGLQFPACGADHLQHVLRPRDDGGVLSHKGTVEVVSSLERDGRPVYRDLRHGVYVVFEAPSEYAKRCFAEYGLLTDASGRYSALYRPYHLIGLELSVSVLRAGVRGEATGSATGFRGDVVTVAKRDLRVGETLDGEGGYCAYGRLMPAVDSLRSGALPIGLAHNVKLLKPVPAGEPVLWTDVEVDRADPTVCIRQEMETRFGGKIAPITESGT
ncbi:MAG: NAD(P)H-dependent oxidoreductase [Chloroflexota bacterium]